MWPFDEELAPTPETPMTSDQTYTMPGPVLQAEAEREHEAGSPWAGVTGAQGDAVDPEALKAAVGHYAEYTPFDMAQVPYSSVEDFDMRKKNGAFRVHEGYGGPGADTKMDLSKSIDLSSADDRLKFLDTFTQQGSGDKNAENMCGPTSLIGGAILANGTQGVTTLLDAVDKMPGGSADAEYIQELRAKLDPSNPQPLNRGDLQAAQQYIYERLNASEGLDVNDPEAMKNATQSQKGVDTVTMQKLLKDPALAKMFKENHMEIANIDTGGKNGLVEDHAVLRMTDEDGKPLLVYDPYARKNGQLTGRIDDWSGEEAATVDNGLADYEYARRGGIRPD